MKKILSLFSIILFSGFILFTGCKKKGEPVPTGGNEQERIDMLSKTWIPGTITFEDGATSLFQNFELTMGNKTYSSSNGYPVYKSSGTWNFKDNSGTPDLNTIILDGKPELELKINTLNETNFNSVITLSNNTTNARTQGTDGTYKFELVVKP